jgi:hypothetical protein
MPMHIAPMHLRTPLRHAVGEREGPVAKQREGEVVYDANAAPTPLTQLRLGSPLARQICATLSPRCAGGEGKYILR